MRVEKMVSIVLTEEEVKQAIVGWLGRQPAGEYGPRLYSHINDNHFCIDYAEGEFVINIDGIYEIEEI